MFLFFLKMLSGGRWCKGVSRVRGWTAIGWVQGHAVALAEAARRFGISTPAISKIPGRTPYEVKPVNKVIRLAKPVNNSPYPSESKPANGGKVLGCDAITPLSRAAALSPLIPMFGLAIIVGRVRVGFLCVGTAQKQNYSTHHQNDKFFHLRPFLRSKIRTSVRMSTGRLRRNRRRLCRPIVKGVFGGKISVHFIADISRKMPYAHPIQRPVCNPPEKPLHDV